MRAALPGYSKTQFIKTRDSKRYLSLISQTCIKRSSLRQRKSGLLRQVTS